MRTAVLSLLALASCAATSQGGPPPEGPQAKLSVLYGARYVSNAYDSANEQELVGVQASYALPLPRWAVEVGWFDGQDEGRSMGTDVESRTTELSVGMLHTFLEGWLRPYAGFGVAWIEAEYDGFVSGAMGPVRVDGDDDSLGFYAAGGFDAWITRHVALGVQYRFLIASDLSIDGSDFDADYGQLALTASVGF